MKYIITTITTLLQFTLAFGQSKLGNEWITGAFGQRIIFNNNTIFANQNHPIATQFNGGNSNICDKNGNLILCSNGFTIYDSLGNILNSGDTLVPKDFYNYENGAASYSQSSIFLPMDSGKYYFITPTFSNAQLADCFANNSCFFDLILYNVIDMNANGGVGKVTHRMIPLMENANLRKTQMMACRHGNGKDWWLLKNEGDSAHVHTFLFTQDSVYDKGVQEFVEPVWGNWDLTGQSVFNQEGNKFATTSHANGILGQVFIADFDRCYGKLANPQIIEIPWGNRQNPNDTTQLEKCPVGLAFSPNGQFLYAVTKSNVYQYDFIDNAIFHVAGIDTSFQYFQDYETSYLAPNNKIYIGNKDGFSQQMSVINNPDVKGAGCNFCRKCLRIDSFTNRYLNTPPCMPNYSLGAKGCYPEGTNDIEKEANGLVVYPNPSVSIFYIKNRKGKMKELYNTVGQMMYSTIKDEMDVSHLPKGMYYLKVENRVKRVIVE